MSDQFVHLHVHTDYSMLDGAAKLGPLFEEAARLGMPALASTDHGNLLNLYDFWKQGNAAGVKPILGVEAYTAPGVHRSHKRPVRWGTAAQKSDDVSGSGAYGHMTMLASTDEGLKNLMAMQTMAQLEGQYKKPRVDMELLDRYGAGIIATTGCPSGEVQTRLRLGQKEEAWQAASDLRDVFGDRLYIELMDHGLDIERRVREDLLAISRDLGIPLVATNDLHYVRQEDATVHDALLAVQTGAQLSDPNRFRFDGDGYYLKSAAEMRQVFGELPEALANTLVIAERCDANFPYHQDLMPRFPVPEGHTAESWLKHEVQRGLADRFPGGIPDEVQTQADYEVGVICQMGFPGYFLVTADFIQWAKSQGIRVGPGRGSGAGSMVAYAMKITDLEPMEHGLIFERFLNPDRVSMPDFDVDFDEIRRGEVIQYVTQKYGAEKVAMIGTLMNIKAKAAVKDATRILGYPYGIGDKVNKAYPPDVMGKSMPLKDVFDPASKRYAEASEFRALYEADSDVRTIVDTAKGLEGLKRGTGVHAAGVIMGAEPLIDHIPLMMREKDGQVITQFEYPICEGLGLVKFDFLGLSNLTTIDDALANIKANRGIDVDLPHLKKDLTDPKVYELLSRADTVGLFQLECVTGDTLVSGRQIANLYAEQEAGNPKRVTKSVRFDTGAWVLNKIVRIVKTGTKPVHRVVTESGRMIEATEGHRFMTEGGGWKELQDLSPGARVLIDPRVKTHIYRECVDCHAQLYSRASRPPSRCYRCSAIYHSNPSKPESRKAISVGTRATFASGRVTWNLGLTKGDDPRMAVAALNNSLAQRGITLEQKVGAERAAELRTFLSARMSGRNNHMFGKVMPHAKRGYRADLGHYVRSSWEADYARVLNYLDEPYEYERRIFHLTLADGREVTYTPDFYLPRQNRFVEIKGFARPLDVAKMAAFVAAHPEFAFQIIDTAAFAELQMQYRDLVAWECPQVPKEAAWETITSITPVGEKDTYDIQMQAPAHNYVANGFVVHNSGGMQTLLRLMRPDNFEDISAVGALYRPGPMGAGTHTAYALRKNGQQAITPIHPELEEPLAEILGDTYGLIVYQEQVMAVAQKVAGYSLGQADLLRRAMGKKKKEVLDKEFVPFSEGMRANGFSDECIQTLWDILVPFSDYAFNKAHSAAYGLITYWTAWLKAHYPAEYMAALLTRNADDKAKTAIFLNECRRMGIEVLSPDVNESRVEYTAVGDSIRVGMGAIRGVGDAPVEAIMAAREEKGKFTDFVDFMTKIPSTACTKKVLDALIKAGAFDSLGHKRRPLAMIHEQAVDQFTATKKMEAIGQDDLFGGMGMDSADLGGISLRIPEVEEWEKKVLLQFEKEMLGLYVSDHPLNGIADALAAQTDTSIVSLFDEGRTTGYNQTVTIGGLVSKLERKTTKNGDAWAVITLEDLDAAVEVLCFPKTYQAVAHLLAADALLLIAARVERNDDGSPKVLAVDVKVPNLAVDGSRPVTITVQQHRLTPQVIGDLREVLSSHHGSSMVHLRVVGAEKTVMLALDDRLKVSGSASLMGDLKALLGAACVGVV